MLDSICSEMNCDSYIEWSFSDYEYEYKCWSCKRQGQSYHITEIAKDCPYRDIVQQRLSAEANASTLPNGNVR